MNWRKKLIDNKKIRKTLLLLFLLIANTTIFAETVALTLDEAVTQAITNNFSIQQEEFTLKKSNISRFASWNVLVPNVGYSATLTKSNVEPTATPLNPNPKEWGLNHSVSLSTPLAARLASNVIDLITPYEQYKSGEITLEKLLIDTAINTHKLYIDLYIAEQMIDYQETRVVFEEEQLVESEKSYKAGLLDEYSYLLVGIETVKAQQMLEEKLAIYEEQTEQLSLLLGNPLDTEYELIEDDLLEIDIDSIEQELDALEEQLFQDDIDLSFNHNLQKLNIQNKIYKLNRVKSILSFFPTVSLSWATTFSFQNDPIEDSWFQTGEEYWGTDTGRLGLTLSIPLSEYHPWSNSSVALRKLQQDILINESQIEQNESIILQQIHAKHRSLDKSITSLEVQEQQISNTERALELAKEGYGSGLASYNNYYESQTNLANANTTYLNYLAQIVKNVLDISALLGEIEVENKEIKW